jgi:hypothetical protein
MSSKILSHDVHGHCHSFLAVNRETEYVTEAEKFGFETLLVSSSSPPPCAGALQLVVCSGNFCLL